MEFAIKQENKKFVVRLGNLRLKFRSADQLLKMIKIEKQLQVTVVV